MLNLHEKLTDLSSQLYFDMIGPTAVPAGLFEGVYSLDATGWKSSTGDLSGDEMG